MFSGVLIPGLILVLLWLWWQAWQRIDAADSDLRARRAPPPSLSPRPPARSFFLARELTPPYSAEFTAAARPGVNRDRLRSRVHDPPAAPAWSRRD